jgi:hypothetical protein
MFFKLLIEGSGRGTLISVFDHPYSALIFNIPPRFVRRVKVLCDGRSTVTGLSHDTFPDVAKR